MHNSTDEQLIALVLDGHLRAFNFLAAKYHQKLIYLMMRFVKDEGTAQDLAQEALIKAYKNLAQFKQEAKFYTWLYRIAVNLAKTWLMQKKNEPQASLDNDEHGTLSDKHTLNAYDTPEEQMHAQQTLVIIQKALDLLPTELRQALILREYEEMSYDDIAVVMECPVGTVRSRIFRAREAVMKAVQQVS